MAWVTAKRALVYAGKRYTPGQSFDTRTEHEAFLLTAVKSVVRSSPPDPFIDPPEPVAAAEPVKRPRGRPRKTPASEPRKRTYKRRDLRAE